MKTKEIDVWVNDYDGLPSIITAKEAIYGYDLEGYFKAKLIIELPEQKIEITESQFDEVCRHEGIGDNTKRYLKKELGFKGE